MGAFRHKTSGNALRKCKQNFAINKTTQKIQKAFGSTLASSEVSNTRRFLNMNEEDIEDGEIPSSPDALPNEPYRPLQRPVTTQHKYQSQKEVDNFDKSDEDSDGDSDSDLDNSMAKRMKSANRSS